MLLSFISICLFCSRVVGQNASIPEVDPPPGGAAFTGLHFASQGNYGCQSRDDIQNGLQKLDQALYFAARLAEAASAALSIPGVERSPAYLRWFGAGEYPQ
jgi:hypothetical protein